MKKNILKMRKNKYISRKKSAFSLLEMMLAMAIFTIIGFSLYNLLDTVTNLQATSLGAQHFKTEGYEILDRMEKQISEALVGNEYAYSTGETIVTEGTGHTKKENITIEFICKTPPGGDPLYFMEGSNPEDARPNTQQLYFTRKDISATLPEDMGNYILSSQGKSPWSNTLLKEMIIYLKNANRLYLYGREEAFAPTQQNFVDGLADNTITGFPAAKPLMNLGENITNIQYLFWGNKSTGWEDNGATSLPITEWDSTVNVNNIHGIGQLPLAMKIILTLTYNPDQYQKRSGDLTTEKNQRMVFEKVIFFKNRNKT